MTTKASKSVHPKSESLNRRRVLAGAVTAAATVAGAAISHHAIAAPAPQAAAPVFKLTPAARELMEIEGRLRAARAALEAIPGPTDLDHHTDASAEWLAACERFRATYEPLAAELHGKSKSLVGQLIHDPVTVDNVVALAVAAQNYPAARAILTCAVLQLAGVRSLPLDAFWQPEID